MAKYRSVKAYGRYGSVGIEVALCIVIGLKAGQWLDARFGRGTSWFTLVGILVGAYSGFRAVYAAAKRMGRDVESDERDEREEYEEQVRASQRPLPRGSDPDAGLPPSREPDSPLDPRAAPPKAGDDHDDDD